MTGMELQARSILITDFDLKDLLIKICQYIDESEDIQDDNNEKRMNDHTELKEEVSALKLKIEELEQQVVK